MKNLIIIIKFDSIPIDLSDNLDEVISYIQSNSDLDADILISVSEHQHLEISKILQSFQFPIRIFSLPKNEFSPFFLIENIIPSQQNCCYTFLNLNKPLNLKNLNYLINPIRNEKFHLCIGTRYLDDNQNYDGPIISSIGIKVFSFITPQLKYTPDITLDSFSVLKSYIKTSNISNNQYHNLFSTIAKVPLDLILNVNFVKNNINNQLTSNEIIYLKSLFYLTSLFNINFIQFLKYSIVGIIGVIVDLGSVVIIKEFFYLDTRICSIISFPIGVTSNYILNRNWTFQKTTTSFWFSYLKFFLTAIFGLGVRVWVIHFLMIFIMKSKEKNYLMITFIGIFAAWIINYFLSKYYVFKDKKN